MERIDRDKRKVAGHLFCKNKYDTVIMDSVLDGYAGSLVVDSLPHPTVARLDSGAFSIFGGEVTKAALELVYSAPIYVVTPESASWRELFFSEFKERVSILPFREYDSSTVKEEVLMHLLRETPQGFTLCPLDRSLCERLPKLFEGSYFFEHYKDIEDFLGRGIGFCAVYKDTPVSVATSSAIAQGAIDIEIETQKEYRGLGLGTVVAARLVAECLKRNIKPMWLAANKESEKLAARLGYTKGAYYETLQIEE